MSRQDRIADQLGDLGDYGVSESGNSVQPIGNPMCPSAHKGSKRPVLSGKRSLISEGRSNPRCDCSRIRAVRSGLQPPRKSCLVIVGNDPHAVAFVVSTNGLSWNAIPPSIIPERGQRSENVAQPSTKQLCDVFHDNVTRSKLANETRVFAPKSATLAFQARASASDADILAREPAADCVNGNSIGSKSLGCEFAHVSIAGDVWPVLCEDTTGKLLYFAERDGLETASALKAQRETADAAEQVEDAQLVHAASPDEVRGEVL